jgi:hypothetical protein
MNLYDEARRRGFIFKYIPVALRESLLAVVNLHRDSSTEEQRKANEGIVESHWEALQPHEQVFVLMLSDVLEKEADNHIT